MDTELIKGSRGIFEVAVDGEVVAKKTFDGFPSEEAIIEAVRRALK